jgi:tetratricopeptide (TPR) repeat protein
MKTALRRFPWCPALLAGMLLLTFTGVQAAPAGPQALVQINDLEGLLRLADRLAAPEGGSPGSQAGPGATLRGLLQGTDWLDPSRAVVLGFYRDGERGAWRALIPFRKANESFRAAFGASAREDAYLLTLPPGAPPVPAPGLEEVLAAASARPGSGTVRLEVAAAELLAQWGPRMREALASKPAAAPADGPDPAALQAAARSLLETLEQVQRLEMVLEGEGEELALRMEALARTGSFMEGVLQAAEGAARLAGYAADYPVRFQSRPYNLRGLMQLVNAGLGPVYRQMGLDLEAFTDMSRDFTGEMAGGLGPDGSGGLMFETVYALHPSANAATFVEAVYLPALEAYGRQLAAALPAEEAALLGPVVVRTADSVVAGRPVAGYRSALGPLPGQASGAAGAVGGRPRHLETRVTTLGDLLLTASDDATLGRLLAQAPSWSPEPAAEGPTMRLQADLGAVLAAWRTLAGPQAPPRADWRPGALTIDIRLEGGRGSLRLALAADDLQGLLQGARRRAPSRSPITAALTVPVVRTSGAAAPRASGPGEGTPDYWMDRGGLLSAYGNYQGALRCFRRALELDPGRAEAAFQMGVAYGELGLFEQAVGAMSQAIERDPARGHYHYGRGRVYLLAGEEELAMKDFMEAAFLGDPDARTYLKEASGVTWE